MGERGGAVVTSRRTVQAGVGSPALRRLGDLRPHVADVVRGTAADGGVRVSELRAEQGPALARVASLVALTDFASVYLALGLGLDPATSPHVADLKERMA